MMEIVSYSLLNIKNVSKDLTGMKKFQNLKNELRDSRGYFCPFMRMSKNFFTTRELIKEDFIGEKRSNFWWSFEADTPGTEPTTHSRGEGPAP